MRITKKVVVGIISIAVLLVALPLMSGCTASAPQEKVFKYGESCPLSGPAATYGWLEYTSELIAAEDINADGGILVGGEYYELEIVQYDNQMDPTVSSTVHRKAISDDGIKYMSVMTINEAAPSMDLARDEGVLLVTSPDLKQYFGPEYPLVFSHIFGPDETESVMLAYLKETRPELKTIANFWVDDLRGHVLAEKTAAVYEEYGYTLVETNFFEHDATDFYSVLTRILDKGVDIIDLGYSGATVKGLVPKQAAELGFEGQYLFPDCLEEYCIDIAGWDVMEGAIAGHQAVEMPTDVGRSWKERYVKRQGTFAFWSHQMYDSLRLLELAIEKADSFDTEKVAQALGEVSYEGITGPTSFEVAKTLCSLPRHIKFKLCLTQIVDGVEVDIYSDFSYVWD